MAEPQPPHAVEVFYSYSHKDEELRDELQKHLALMKRQGIIKDWHDRGISPGQEWSGQIDEHLNSADIILLLISSDFLASSYCYDIEVKRAMERHEAKEATVIPIILRPCDWSAAPFGKLQALPKDARPVTSWSNQDEAFLNVVKGIREAAEELLSSRAARQTRPDGEEKFKPRSEIPRPPIVGFVARRDRDGRDILSLLKQELAPGRNNLLTLSGAGGFGKTTIAAEAFRELGAAYEGRLVWSDVNARAGYTLPTLLDDIATQLARPDLRALAPEPKSEAVRALLTERPALVALDNYEAVDEAERKWIERWLADAPCSSLITSRQRVRNTLPVTIPAMPRDEAEKFLDARISVTQDPQLFTVGVRQRIYKEAEANPFLMEWVVAQIDEAQEPGRVLKELRRGEGDAAERVFGRSFMLPQVGDDGRAALLALSLFVPSASREALAAVAGFGDDEKRLNAALKSLHALWLVRGVYENRRFTVEGLTRALTTDRLSSNSLADEFRRRFVRYFVGYSKKFSADTPEHFDALEREKDNVLAAINLACELEEWQSALQIAKALHFKGFRGFLPQRGYWDDSLKMCEAALRAAKAEFNLGFDEEISHIFFNQAYVIRNWGDNKRARLLYTQILQIAKKTKDEATVADTLHELGWLAQDQGEINKADDLYRQSLKIKKRIDDQTGIALTYHELGRLAQDQGKLAEAAELYEESLSRQKALPTADRIGMANNLHELGRVAHNREDRHTARKLYEQSLEIKRQLNDARGIAITSLELGRLTREQRDFQQAQTYLDQSLAMLKDLADQRGLASAYHELGRLAHERGDTQKAGQLYDKSLEINKTLRRSRGIAMTLYEKGRLKHDQFRRAGERRCLAEAEQLYLSALEIQEALPDQIGKVNTLFEMGRLAEERGFNRKARRLFNQSVKLKNSIYAASGERVGEEEKARK